MKDYVDLNKKQRMVLAVIRRNPGVQNNDARLIAAVWRYEGWRDDDPLEVNIARVTRPETITRRRRELHEWGLITYSKDATSYRENAMHNEQDRAAPASSPATQRAVSWLND